MRRIPFAADWQMCTKLVYYTHRGIIMRTNVDLDDVLMEKAMNLTQLTTKKAVINKALEELIKSNTRKKMLKYIDSGIWEGSLKEMRTMR